MPWCIVLTGLCAHAQVDATRVRLLISLLRGVEQEYREAFDETGALVRPVELEEAAFLLADARARAAQLGNEGPADLVQRVATLVQAVEGRAPVERISADARDLRTRLAKTTGVAEEMFPLEPPSPDAGADLYRANCVSCHGEGGAGDGPDAARLARHPADFRDPAFVRNETPIDFFLVISLGRRGGGMPAWDDALNVQERWDLVSYLWSLHGDDRLTTAGQRLFVDHCAECHMPAATDAKIAVPSGPPAAFFSALERMAVHTDADLFASITQSPAHAASAAFRSLGEDDRWNLVAFVRTPSLGAATQGEAGGGTGDRFERALARVEKRIAEAVNAYRLKEGDASELAADAYLAFEPLEARIAARDPAQVRRAEAEFLRLQKVIRQPDSMKEVEEAAAAARRALADAKQPLTGGTGELTPLLAAGVVIAVVVSGVIVSSRRR